MNRRVALQAIGTVTLAAVAGCIDKPKLLGENETLEIRNEYGESVTLEISIEESGPPMERSIVFDESITVGASKTITRDVLGNDQFYLTVQRGEQRHEFGTRPICDDAFTRIVVTEDGRLDSEVEDCE